MLLPHPDCSVRSVEYSAVSLVTNSCWLFLRWTPNSALQIQRRCSAPVTIQGSLARLQSTTPTWMRLFITKRILLFRNRSIFVGIISVMLPRHFSCWVAKTSTVRGRHFGSCNRTQRIYITAMSRLPAEMCYVWIIYTPKHENTGPTLEKSWNLPLTCKGNVTFFPLNY